MPPDHAGTKVGKNRIICWVSGKTIRLFPGRLGMIAPPHTLTTFSCGSPKSDRSFVSTAYRLAKLTFPLQNHHTRAVLPERFLFG